MICCTCSKDLRKCECPDITARLKTLIASDHVYVGNIIEDRFRSGLSEPEEFHGLNIHHPASGPIGGVPR